MKITHLKSKALEDGSIEVEIEVKEAETNRNLGDYTASGKTLLGAIGNALCKMLDDEVGEIKNEEALGTLVKNPYGGDLVTMRIHAEHDGKEKEVIDTGEGIMETVVKSLKKLKHQKHH